MAMTKSLTVVDINPEREGSATQKRENDCPKLEYLTAEQAARRIGVSVEFIYDACASKGLKHIRLAGRRNIRIKPEWLDEWMFQSAIVNA